MRKIKVGILGATGMVGQRFICLLENHQWFQVSCLVASSRSAGKSYKEAVKGRWQMKDNIPPAISRLKVMAIEEDIDFIVKNVDFVFSAIDMDKEQIQQIEIAYAQKGVPVVSNNSAHRWTKDIPMIIPEVNPYHLQLIDLQKQNRRWKKGFIVTKPNCSIQSYVSILTSLQKFKPLKVVVTSLQAISGAGKTFESWPEMVDNAIPFINGEEDKSEKEPLKIWGKFVNGQLKLANKPLISATCIRIPVTDGHMASVSVKFVKNPTRKELLKAISSYKNPLQDLNLPSSSKSEFIKYFEEENRPQTKLERDYENGMGITMGRLREDSILDWKFIALSHNTIRGAAGGAILLAELLTQKGYIKSKDFT